MMAQISGDWQEKVRLKREAQAKALAAVANADLQGIDVSVVEIDDIPTLAGLIASGKLTSESVTKAYIDKAVKAHNQTNCLTEILFSDALAQARQLDEYFKKHGTVVGPLHGIPTTLKDQFNVKGYDSTLGYVSRAFKPASEDAVLVKMLKKLGAVVLAKTNLPQSIMWCETDNPLWGLTTNPLSAEYTPGGSTGGEAALLSLQGSLLGWGTDLGGSVRIPSSMMGLYGLKPSFSRLPYHGAAVTTDGQEHVPSSVGPLARDISSLTFVMKELIQLEPWKLDARCAPVPWRNEIYEEFRSKPLTIGVLADDGVIQPHPPMNRVLQDLVRSLELNSHDIVEWNADLHAECIEVMDEFYTADGGEDIRREVEAGGEPFIPHVEALVNKGQPISVYNYWQLNKRKFALQQAYLEKWDAIRSPKTGKQVDIVLMPPMPHTAVPHRSCRWVGYTKIWNVLDYTALVLPAGQVRPYNKEEPWNFLPRNVLDEHNMALWSQQGDKMIELRLPVGVQIVGRKLEEEKVLAIGAAISDFLD